MFRKLTILTLLCSALSFGSCIKEDLTDCPPDTPQLRLQFSFTLNSEHRDQLQERVGNIKVYVFDRSTDLLADTIEVNSADIALGYKDITLPEGEYTFTAWGGASNDLFEHGFMAAQLDNPNISADVAYTNIPQAQIGVTKLSDFRLMLETRSLEAEGMDPTHVVGDVAPVGETTGTVFDDLFFAAQPNVTVVAGEQQTIPLALLKDTSICHVKVTGLQYLAAAAGVNTRVDTGWAPEVYITGSNERYGYDNSIDSYAREVCYMPPYTSLTDSVLMTDIKVLRLDIRRFADEPIQLHIRDAATGEDMLPPIDIIDDVLLKAEDGAGRQLIPDQNAIDILEEFPIDISILADLSVSISVLGYEISYPGADIGLL